MRRNGMKWFEVGVVMSILLFALPIWSTAAEWKPTKPIEFVAPYAPGGGSDVLARSIASIIEGEKLCPQPLVVVNRPGGSGLIGTTSVVQQRGNPHVLLTFIPGQAQAALVAGKGAPTFRELTLICNLALDEQLIVVKTDSPFKNITDIIAEAKRRPGELTVGGTGSGQDDQICQSLFERSAGIRLRYVPFKSGGECITALLGGHVHMIWANPPEFVPQWEAKMVRPLAVARTSRMSEFPDVPAFKELGHHVTYFFYRGIAAPADIPAEAAAFYETMFRRMAESSSWKEKYLKKYMLSPGWMGSKEFAKIVAQNEAESKEILKDLGLLK
ncbi:MAG: tripartite tricarboxylate transporter substrate binding protein [Syntrophaceae bacterium]|nr:tripartite tricarboxylate transporter substrate binding protein [Syntrophaceae bacterium]